MRTKVIGIVKALGKRHASVLEIGRNLIDPNGRPQTKGRPPIEHGAQLPGCKTMLGQTNLGCHGDNGSTAIESKDL